MLFTVFVKIKILADAVNVVLAVAVAVIILALFFVVSVCSIAVSLGAKHNIFFELTNVVIFMN